MTTVKMILIDIQILPETMTDGYKPRWNAGMPIHLIKTLCKMHL